MTRGFALAAIVGLAVGSVAHPLFAGGAGFFNNRAVGGISINTEGVVAATSPADKAGLLKQMREQIKPAQGQLGKASKLRMVSLKALDAAAKQAIERNAGKLPAEMEYLAGLQRIEYVFVYPELNDIVLAGPAEGWKVSDSAPTVVGAESGMPTLKLDDLLVALRYTASAQRKGGITCSIDPTEEGRRRFEQFMSRQNQFSPRVLRGIEDALGPQRITVTGVPDSSHFARVLVASDFRMKRYAMGLEEAPIRGLPSFLSLMKSTGKVPQNMMPRWWLAADFKTIERTEDMLAWHLPSAGVKCQTEDDFIGADGAVEGSGGKNPIAARWAKLMTEKYDELAAKDPVFRDLRNVMNLCVVAALIHKHGLLERAECELPTLLAEDGNLMYNRFDVPRQVATQTSFVKTGRTYIITASGGVDVNAFEVTEGAKLEPKLTEKLTVAIAPPGNSWWWDK